MSKATIGQICILLLLTLALGAGLMASGGTAPGEKVIAPGTLVCPSELGGCAYVGRDERCCYYTCGLICETEPVAL